MASSGSSAADRASRRARCAGPATREECFEAAWRRAAAVRRRARSRGVGAAASRPAVGAASLASISGASARTMREIVARLERARHDQRFALHLVERVFELGALIGRIDVDQDRADARGAELRIKPFGRFGAQMPTRSPRSMPSANRPAATSSERRRRSYQDSALAGGEDRRIAGAVARAAAIEELRDGHELERIVARPRHIGERPCGRRRSSAPPLRKAELNGRSAASRSSWLAERRMPVGDCLTLKNRELGLLPP